MWKIDDKDICEEFGDAVALSKVKVPKEDFIEFYKKFDTIGSLVNTKEWKEVYSQFYAFDKFEQDIEEKKEPVVYDDRVDIIDAYLSLPARDKRAIYKTYEEAFGNYGVNLKMQSNCTSCGNQDEYDIDLVESFFRSLFSA